MAISVEDEQTGGPDKAGGDRWAEKSPTHLVESLPSCRCWWMSFHLQSAQGSGLEVSSVTRPLGRVRYLRSSGWDLCWDLGTGPEDVQRFSERSWAEH